ncbi:MAG TPA: aminotransferase class I/II-fold pyridoxal phosphate-dependent enzyme [Acidimicrobiales bacterium]|nr:aminotransferase class I/II-fold pyridoxal phosphate-dependent enzyme [Acidimicrobiales bacterium]
MTESSKWHAETLAIVAGRAPSPGGPFNVPPTFASTYRDGGHIGYGRWGNPTWSAFEETLGELEGGHCVSFASGLAAVSALLASLPIGTKVVYPSGGYNGTRALLERLEKEGRLSTRAVDVVNTTEVLDAMEGVDMLWLESPTNPLLGVADLPTILRTARDTGIVAVVDNTFATPILQQPLALGASAVVHSATKYIGGHSDLLMGAVIVAEEGRRDELVEWRTTQGAVPGVMEAFLALRGLRTLPVRFARQQRSAAELAERLDDHRHVSRVRYPGLVSDPGFKRASSQMGGFGAMVSFEVNDAESADRVVQSLQLIVGGTSLGGVETTIDRRSRWKGEESVPEGLLRLSVGLEHPVDLWADLDEALKSVFAHS